MLPIPRSIIQSFIRTFASKYRPISPQLRFHLDTKAVYGSQHVVKGKRSTKPSEFDLINTSSTKNIFENDTDLLYGTSNSLHRAGSVPKGISIGERSKYLRHLFRIPRGQPISLYPQAYVPNKDLGLRKKKDE